MKAILHPSIRLLLAAAAAALISSCASPVESRIARFPAEFSALPPAHQQLAAQGRISEGMTRDGVFFAWGPPHRVAKGREAGRDLEQWRYYSREAVHTYSFGFGHGYPYHGWCPGHGYGHFDFGPEIYFVPRHAATVNFRGGLVSAWSREY